MRLLCVSLERCFIQGSVLFWEFQILLIYCSFLILINECHSNILIALILVSVWIYMSGWVNTSHRRVFFFSFVSRQIDARHPQVSELMHPKGPRSRSR